jgi:chromosomal replication initiation ATPase DnaA
LKIYLKAKNKKSDCVVYRRIYCYVARVIVPRYSLLQIGALVNYKEHSAVIHQIETAAAYIKNKDSDFMDYWFHFIEHSELWKLHKQLQSL